jgi:Cd2+/Zn2+-exporting ATPase
VKPGTENRLRAQVASTLAALVGTVTGWLFPTLGLPALALPAFLLAYAAGGWSAATRAFGAVRRGELDVDVLMLLAAAGAAAVGHWLEGAILLFLFSLGNTLESFAFKRTRRSIEALVELRPDEALRVDGSEEHVVAVDALRPGDIVRVIPGDRIPIDGDVVGGASAVDESTLTGEPVPVTKGLDAHVFAGTLNTSGYLDIRMTRAADDTTLARIIRLVERAREGRAPTQSWIEEVEGRYAFGVILAAGAAILIPWLVMGWTFDDSFYRAMTLLVVASPCALVISIPATIVSAVSNGARHGILFKGGAHLDSLSEVTTFALDKTGTVTVGHPEVVAVHAAADGRAAARAGAFGSEWGTVPPSSGLATAGRGVLLGEARLLVLAGSAEARSEHHLGAAIVRFAEERGLAIPDPESFDSVPGHGLRARVEGETVEIGRRSWIEEQLGSPVDAVLLASLEAAHPTATQVHVAVDGLYAGAFAVQDHPRAGAREAVAALRTAGITRVVMLTGDSEGTAKAVAEQVGISEVHAALKPDEKSRILEELKTGGAVAMVGDGVNDAPALATADVGIAIGLAGTDVALETADVVVMGEDLGALARAVRLSRRTRRIVKQNLVFAVGMMAALVFAALMGWIGLTAGVIGHEGSTVVVVFNGLRLLADGR